ncbi:Mrp/NBP35 family ATP-binding protein [Candidatus Bathyarchaeota archaeon]|nr:MAG: Mrp/NBP35 family ATP-binding protein [Candidatus Bathyarchaeota archaeon]
MLDKAAILEQLRGVLDPEIGISIVDLNMVRDIGINEDGIVQVKIALTVQHCPMAKTLQADVEKAVGKLDGVKSVNVETTAMSKKELEELRVKLTARGTNSQISQSGQNTSTAGPGINKLGKRGIRNIIAIVSGKGGVGKSFVTSMLATELRRKGYEVGVLDADLTGPSIAKVFGLSGKPYKAPNGLIVPAKSKTGIKVMSINLVLDDPTMPVIWRGPIVNSVIRQLYWDVDWGDVHYLLVDLPPGTSDSPLTVFQSLPVDGVIVVSSPQDLAAMIVAKAVNMAKKMEAPIMGLVENMSYFQCPGCGEKVEIFGQSNGSRLAAQLDIPYLGGVPLDPEIARLSDQGRIEEYSSPVFENITAELRQKAVRQVEQLTQGLPIAWTVEPQHK